MEYRRSLEWRRMYDIQFANEKNTYSNISLIILITGGYLYIRFSVLKPKDFKPDTSKSKSIVDLRPQLIAKLRQMVKDGSDGLYNLSIGKIEPHISSGGMDMMTIRIVPDSLTVSKLKSSPVAPGGSFQNFYRFISY